MSDFSGRLPTPEEVCGIPPSMRFQLPNPLKQGSFRNSPCFCDSGKKYKRCCWNDQPDSVDLGKFVQAKAFLEIREKHK